MSIRYFRLRAAGRKKNFRLIVTAILNRRELEVQYFSWECSVKSRRGDWVERWSRNTVVEPSQNHSRYFYSRTKPLTKFNSARGQSRFPGFLKAPAHCTRAERLAPRVTPRRSSRAMARTGLRMMPTFPSPPLKFRTAGFPQYGFKASMSDRACRQARNLKPAPGIRSLPRSLLLSFARFRHRRSPGSVSKTVEASTCRCAGGLPSLPQGSLARFELCCLDPSSLTTPPCASLAGTLRLHVFALIPAPSLCGSASATRETFPTFTTVLSLHAADPTPVVHRAFLLPSHGDSRLPRIISESPTHSARLCQLFPTGLLSGLHRSLYATACMFASPS